MTVAGKLWLLWWFISLGRPGPCYPDCCLYTKIQTAIATITGTKIKRNAGKDCM